MLKDWNRETTEISLRFNEKLVGSAEMIRHVLFKEGIRAQDIIESYKNGFVTLSLFVPKAAAAQKIKRNIQNLQLKNVFLKYQILRARDWLKKSKENFKPFKLTSSFDIVPFWHRRRYKKTLREPIYIDTTGAFGSGLHETTRFMGQLIEHCRGRFSSFCDIGTGTGILTLIALKCNAQEAAAIDMDDFAVAAARKNLKVNGYHAVKLTCQDIKSLKVSKKYDFVAANLVTKTLIRFKRKICSLALPGKYFALSGISLEKLGFLREEFKRLPVKCLKVKKGKDWAAVLYQRI